MPASSLPSPLVKPAYLQLVLLPVDDNSGDLLVHEHQDHAEQGRNRRRQSRPPGVAVEEGNQPAATRPRGLELVRHAQLGRVDAGEVVDRGHDDDGDDDAEVADEATHLRKEGDMVICQCFL